MLGPEEPEMQSCMEHGDYPADEFFCPGCEEDERRIDDAIERSHERGEWNGQA